MNSISPISGAPSRFIFQHKVLGKYDARYFLDDSTGYIFAEKPFWLKEAYSQAIADTDTGILNRNNRNVEIVSHCLAANRYELKRGIDLGGGYGLFVRGMRDAGFEFFWTDRYADNLVAKGFEAAPGRYDVAVAFEVLEHLENPLEFVKENFERFGCTTLFFSATCFDEADLPDTNWWYWAFETGQHIGFVSERTLHWMAKEIGMRLWPVRDDVYAFTSLEWKPLVTGSIAKVWTQVRRRIDRLLLPHQGPVASSLTFTDHINLRNKLRRDGVSSVR